MDKMDFDSLSKTFSPIIEKLITDNVRFFRFKETIKWCFEDDDDISIMAACNRKTNVISLNINSVVYSFNKGDLKTIEYYLLHEIRHVFQHLVINDYKKGLEIPIEEDIVKKWIFESENYVKSLDSNGNENPKYFLQDSEMDAYAYSYAVMKYKYINVDYLWVYKKYGDKFWNLVNDWIETFKEEHL